MTFAQIPTNVGLSVDANTLVYHFAPDPVYRPACQQLMARIALQDIVAFTCTDTVADVAHRLMTLEAMARFGWPQAGIANRLRRHPSEVQTLGRFRKCIDDIPRLGIQVLPVEFHHLTVATAISQQTGLLTSDAIIVAVMRHEALTHLASADTDFDRVPGLTRYAPA
jgi:predicted nucleic acid-binding protein